VTLVCIQCSSLSKTTITWSYSPRAPDSIISWHNLHTRQPSRFKAPSSSETSLDENHASHFCANVIVLYSYLGMSICVGGSLPSRVGPISTRAPQLVQSETPSSASLPQRVQNSIASPPILPVHHTRAWGNCQYISS
jgi:hypothetical protein